MMRRGIQYLFLVLSFLLSLQSISAQTIKAAQSGPWSEEGTWNPNRVPNITDDVLIEGFQVDLDVDADVNSIEVKNTSDPGILNVNGLGVTLVIKTDLRVINQSNSFFDHSEVNVSFTDSVYVGGLVYFQRAPGFQGGSRCRLMLADDARFVADAGFSFDYHDALLLEGYAELYMLGDSKLYVNGDMNFTSIDGSGMHQIIQDQAEVYISNDLNLTNQGALLNYIKVSETASVNVTGNVNLKNEKTTGTSSSCYVRVEGGYMDVAGNLSLTSMADQHYSFVRTNGAGAAFKARRDINFLAQTDLDAYLDIELESKLFIGGNFNRSPSGFGTIEMDDDTKLIYNGSGSQTIAESNALNSQGDYFQFSNVEIDNKSGGVLTLEGPMVVEKELIFKNGIIESSDSAPVIFQENAVPSGANNNAYVQGPVIKEGAVSGASFTFPIGDMGLYAPFEIAVPKSGSTVAYTASYSGCPPPLGTSLDGLVTISGGGHWEFESSLASPQVDVTLHWQQANNYGITDLSTDLVVAMYDGDVDLADGNWVSIGQGSVNADGSNNNGWISNAIGCPPPLGGTVYTFGSVSGSNPLPVVLSKFEAQPKGQVVNVSWETASDFNADFFTVQRSSNGVNFSEIYKQDAEKNGDITTFYHMQDKSPERGANYYRLCQVDNMGFKVYSQIELAYFEEETVLTVFPNPVRDIMTVKGEFTTRAYDLEVFDASGLLLAKKSIMGEKEYLQINVDDLQLPESGMLFLNISGDGVTRTVPFVKT